MCTIADFEKVFYSRLKQQGTSGNPKRVTLIVLAWEPQGKGEPALSAVDLQQMIFNQTVSLAHWFQEVSQGRYQIIPHPITPVIGPFPSRKHWTFYWREGQFDPRNLNQGDPHYYVNPADPEKIVYYLDEDGYISGHRHAYAECVRFGSNQPGINYKDFDLDGDNVLSFDECGFLIVKAQAITKGYRRPVTGSDIPLTKLQVDGVYIGEICELYAAPPHGIDDLAVAIEEVSHLLVDTGDQYPDTIEQYPDGVNLKKHDPGRSGQLSLSDAGGRPVHLDPYHKLKFGWLNPQLADHSGTYTLREAGKTGDALILYSPYLGTDEFFILENRWRGDSYDRFRDDNWKEGLALWHCIQDPNIKDYGRQAMRLRRADPRLDSNGFVKDHMALFDGSDPARSYDLHDDSYPQNLRFRNGVPSRIRIRKISSAGPQMTVEVEVPPEQGEIVITEGLVKMIRVHEHGTGYGPSNYRINEDCIITLDSEPGTVFSIDLYGANAPAVKKMFDLIRSAYMENKPIRVEYESTNMIGGRIIRVIKS